MSPARRFAVAVRLTTAGLVAGSIIATAAPASAAPPPAWNPFKGPDLTVAVSASPNPVHVGTTHTYVLQVTNISWAQPSLSQAPRPVPGPTLSNVRVHLASYPSNETFVSAHDDSGAGFQCYVPAEYFGFDVRCVGGTIPTFGTAQITITTTAPTSVGTFSTTATVDPYNEIAEANENNNSASVSFSTN